MNSPTARSLKFLRAAGYTCGNVEKRIPNMPITQDLFGFIDLVAMRGDQQGLLAIQTTSGSNHATRRTKILGLPAAKLWLESGNRIWVVSWKKVAKTKKWEPRVEPITLADFVDVEAAA